MISLSSSLPHSPVAVHSLAKQNFQSRAKPELFPDLSLHWVCCAQQPILLELMGIPPFLGNDLTTARRPLLGFHWPATQATHWLSPSPQGLCMGNASPTEAHPQRARTTVVYYCENFTQHNACYKLAFNKFVQYCLHQDPLWMPVLRMFHFPSSSLSVARESSRG